jgi:hypothetical protein
MNFAVSFNDSELAIHSELQKSFGGSNFIKFKLFFFHELTALGTFLQTLSTHDPSSALEVQYETHVRRSNPP